MLEGAAHPDSRPRAAAVLVGRLGHARGLGCALGRDDGHLGWRGGDGHEAVLRIEEAARHRRRAGKAVDPQPIVRDKELEDGVGLVERVRVLDHLSERV